MVKIRYENGKYLVDAEIHTEVSTSDIAEVQEHFIVDCCAEFAEKLKSVIRVNELFEKTQKEREVDENTTKYFS